MSKAFLQFAKESKKPRVEQYEWMKDVVMELVTPDTLSRVIQECIDSGLYALDLETTGLDTRVFNNRTKDQIVGACLSPDGLRGYYIPVRHRGNGAPHNIAISLFEEEMRRLVTSPAVAIFHNGKFDQEFLQFSGGEPIGEWDDPKKWEDTLILAYLRNTRERRKGLKALSDSELGAKMIELKDLFPPDTKDFDYSELDPSWDAVVWYAASDSICTYNLYKVLHPQVVGADAKPNQATVYQIEKMDCAAVRWMERNRVHIDQDKVAELIRLGQRELFQSIKDVYDFCGEYLERDVSPAWWHVFSEGVQFTDEDGKTSKDSVPAIFDPDDIEQDINAQIEEAKKVVSHNAKRPAWDQSVELADISSRVSRKLEKTLSNGEVHEFPLQYDIMSAKQLGPLMEEMEVPDLRKTEKSKQVMTTGAEMDRLTELHGDTFPFMARIKRFREVQKGLSTFLFPLRVRSKGGDADDSDSTIKINYNAWKVDTGRFATPGSRRPEIDGGTSYNMHSTPAGYDPNKPACVRRLRECIRVRDDNKLLVACDFSGVELRIVTNLSREPKWLSEFFRCSQCEHTFDRGDGKTTPEAPPPFCPKCGSDKIGDLHTLSAISFYGEDAQKDKTQFKQYRQKSKGVNFALCYGGSGKAVTRTINCDDNEGWRIYRQFSNTYKGLQSWWKNQHTFAKANGYVLTAFGRKYPVPDVLLPKKEKDPVTKQWKDNGAFIAKAERNSVNGPIQATSADITKLAMALVYKECKKRGWLKKVLMTITIHDELVFEIDKDIIEEALDVIMHIMTTSPPVLKLRWPIPLTLDCEFGMDWTVPWNLVDFQYGKKEWPEELKEFFPNKVEFSKKYLAAQKKGQALPEVSTSESQNDAEEPAESKITAEVVQEERAPELASGETFVHRLRSSMKQGTVERLAKVLHRCKNRGSHPIQVISGDGLTVLWESPEDFTVNPTMFLLLADELGV